MVTKTVSITNDDIQAGIVGDCARCPAALAVRRAFGITDDLSEAVSVGSVYIYIILPGYITADVRSCMSDADADKFFDFLRRFDSFLPVEPLEIEVTLYPAWIYDSFLPVVTLEKRED